MGTRGLGRLQHALSRRSDTRGRSVKHFVATAAIAACLPAPAGAELHQGLGSYATAAQPRTIKPAHGTPGAALFGIHGGSWLLNGPEAVRLALRWDGRFVRRGWLVHNVDYRPGAAAFGDVLAEYDRFHRQHRRLPVCAQGDSAGGHLALMLAAARPSVRCVIAEAAPTDLVDYPDTPLRHVIDDLAPYVDLAGPWSPARHPWTVRQPVLLAYATNDPVVPYEQGIEMKRAAPNARLWLLHAGDRRAAFPHSRIDGPARHRELAYERRFTDAFRRPP